MIPLFRIVCRCRRFNQAIICDHVLFFRFKYEIVLQLINSQFLLVASLSPQWLSYLEINTIRQNEITLQQKPSFQQHTFATPVIPLFEPQTVAHYIGQNRKIGPRLLAKAHFHQRQGSVLVQRDGQYSTVSIVFLATNNY